MNVIRKDVLNGWKEIAAYLGRDPRTVERWEKQRSLPVRRLPGSGRATVYALVAELDEWLAGTPARDREPEQASVNTAPEPEPGQSPAGHQQPVAPVDAAEPTARAEEQRRAPGRRPRWIWWAVAAGIGVLLFAVGLAPAGWRRRGVQPTEAVATGRIRKMVPSSAVLGVEELYLRGTYQAELRTPESLRRAQEAFLGAVAKDPRYAPAFAGLASTYILQREYAMVPDRDAYPKATAAAERALALDPALPQAHAVKGFVEFFWNWNGVSAEKEFQQAMALDPDLPLARHWYGSVLTHEGRFREGLAQLEAAQRLDPSSGAILTSRAFALGLSGQKAQATELLQEAISSEKLGPYRNPATMHRVLANLSLLPPREVPRYLSESLLVAEILQDEPNAQVMRMAVQVYRSQGEHAMWEALLADERKRHAQGGPTYSMARYEAELGAKEQALNDLADLFSRHDPELMGISVDPLLLGLHKEPRFLQLRTAMGLPGVDQI